MSPEKKTTPIQLGGSIEHSLNRKIPLNINQIFSEGWSLTRHTKWVLLTAIIGVGCCIVLASMLIHGGGRWLGYSLADSRQLMLVNLILAMLFSPMTAALSMIGICHAAGLTTRTTQIFDFYRFIMPLANCTLLATLLSEGVRLLMLNLSIPPLFSLLSSLYFMTCFSFAAPLAIEKRMPSLRAMTVSFRVVNRQLLGVVLIYSLLVGLLFLAVIPLGIGLIWIAPLFFNIKGVLYRELFGVRLTLVDRAQTGTMTA